MKLWITSTAPGEREVVKPGTMEMETEMETETEMEMEKEMETHSSLLLEVAVPGPWRRQGRFKEVRSSPPFGLQKDFAPLSCAL